MLVSRGRARARPHTRDAAIALAALTRCRAVQFKVDEIVQYHVGETVCGLQRATLTPGGADAIVYWTLYGVRAPWLRRVLARLLTQLHAVCGGKTAVLCVGQVSGIGIDMLCVLGGHIDRLGGCVGHLHRHAGCVSGTCCVCLER